MDLESLWQAALGELEVVLSRTNFSTWFKNTFIHSFENGEVTLGVPNSFHKEWLENKFHSQILKTLSRLNPQIKKIKYKVISKTPPLPPKRSTIEVGVLENKHQTNLNPYYTFETFVVGPSNRLAHAAAKAVVDSPGQVYNPLFIYGGVGLGKTHLMQAIGNEVIQKSKNKKVVYTTCEKFTNDFIKSIQSGRVAGFKEKYRNTDILLIDDIHFLVGKETTQEEFFHTFNTLYQNNKQIVITSDRPPKALSALEDRLISRFAGGMVADISPPDLETRIAILKQKRKEKNYNIGDDVLEFIAKKIEQNIRELEGALTRLMATCQLQGQPPSLELASQILGFLWTKTKGIVNAKKILEVCADFYGIRPEDFVDKKRDKEFTHPRQVVMYLLRHELNYSFPKIGKELKRDHTTIMYGCEKIEKEMVHSDGLKQEISLIKTRLYEP